MSAQNFCLKKVNLDLSAKTFSRFYNNGCGKIAIYPIYFTLSGITTVDKPVVPRPKA